MRFFFACLAIVLAYSSCADPVPDGLVQPKRMPALLVDIHLADGELASLPIDSARASRDALYETVFKHYGIDSVTFRKTMGFYATRPDLLNSVYKKVEKRLTDMNLAEQKKIDDKYQAERRADSIRNMQVLDSLNRIKRDSLDFKRRRYLLLQQPADSIYGMPIPVTYEALHKRLLEPTGVKVFEAIPDTLVQDTLKTIE